MENRPWTTMGIILPPQAGEAPQNAVADPEGIFYVDSTPPDSGLTRAPRLPAALLSEVVKVPVTWNDGGAPIYADGERDDPDWPHPETEGFGYFDEAPIEGPFGQEIFYGLDVGPTVGNPRPVQLPTGTFPEQQQHPWDWDARVTPDGSLCLGVFDKLVAEHAKGEGPFSSLAQLPADPSSEEQQPQDNRSAPAPDANELAVYGTLLKQYTDREGPFAVPSDEASSTPDVHVEPPTSLQTLNDLLTPPDNANDSRPPGTR